ncbi:MAG: 3-hydroxyacyl-CoA dehydrogenase/enoyl-CoA hydratase family protein [Planctomycetes bacterium]|nr:3-hydroxyacyl-CoA dehydrogenase/enoyl-CoA hydratase family protein [Planctomycetota bacterium]
MSFAHRGRTLTKVAVIGSGQIGPDIALYFTKVLAPFGVKTVVVDVAAAALEKGRAKLEKKVAKGVESGAFTADQQAQMVGHVEWTTDYAAIAGAELVVEAATENDGLKRRIFSQVEGLVAADAILASNSSHLEPEVIFAEAKHQERTTVIHYFFPAERNPIVEIVPQAKTAGDVTAWLMSFYEAIGKVPIRVKSRYGYALDPIFEGLFQASALLAQDGVATTKQLDTIATKALGLTVGSFTAMNLTGGNPITAVGLDHYTTKINSWFGTPQLLKDRVASGQPWDVPKRGEQVEVPDALREQVTRLLRGAYFGLVCEVIDAGLIDVSDFDMALEIALDMKPAFRFMNELGTAEALKLCREYAARYPSFPVPRCLQQMGATNEPFELHNVLREDRDGVAVLTIRRPKVLNALDQGVFDEIADRCAEADADPGISAIVLTGHGRKAFVSGADVGFLAKIESVAHGTATSAKSQASLNRVEDCRKPIVCAMNGLAFGGGNELAMACTARIAPRGLKVLACQPEVNLGIIPGAGGTQRLPRLVGLAKAAELMRTARPVSSAEALQIGLLREEVDGDLLDRAVELARGLAAGTERVTPMPTGPLADVPDALPAIDIGHRSRAVDAILCRAILDGCKRELRAGIAYEAECFGAVCGTRDMRIGVDNFIGNGPRSKAAFVHA